jgi:hypothetical protein
MQASRNKKLTSETRIATDASWMIPFFAIIATGIAFFFWQVALYGLLPQ